MMGDENLVEGRKGEWMQVASGGKFFPEDPRPEEVHINDIANALALTCRYGGQGHIDKFYSVAEHSFLMAENACDYSPGLLKVEKAQLALAALMHDAAEAYTGDLIRAVKVSISGPYGRVEDNIQRVILEKCGLVGVSSKWASRVKELDNRIVVNEKAALFGNTQTWISDKLKPLEGTVITCHIPPIAKKLWLGLFWHLIQTPMDKHVYNRNSVKRSHPPVDASTF